MKSINKDIIDLKELNKIAMNEYGCCYHSANMTAFQRTRIRYILSNGRKK